MNLPVWKCHKTVEGFKIDRIVGNSLISADAQVFVIVSDEYMERHKPFIGGYFVRYSDDYESFSPPEVFEAGYSQKRRVLHVRLPEHLTPSTDDMHAVLDMFLSATEDPEGGVVVTGHGVKASIEETYDGETYGLVCVSVGEDDLAKIIEQHS